MTTAPSAVAPVLDPSAVTFGLRVPNSGPFAQSGNIHLLADLAGKSGFRALWAHDHIPWARERLTHFASGSVEACQGQDPNFFESLTTATYLAGVHQDLIVGLAGLVLPLRDPRVLARQLLTVQALTGGRLISALAIGNIPNDFDVMQVPYTRRGRITDEYLSALAEIFQSNPSSFQGEHVAFENAEFYPQVRQHIWIAGNSPPAYRRIARFGTGWLPGMRTPDEYRQDLSLVEEAVNLESRSVHEINRGVELFVCVRPTDAEAVEIANETLILRARSLERGLGSNLIGSPRTVYDHVKRFIDAGVTHFECRFIYHDLDAHLQMLQTFADQVIGEL